MSIRRRDNEHDKKPASLRRILPYFNLVLAFALSIGLAGVTHRIVDNESDERALEHQLSRAQADMERTEQTTVKRMAELEAEKARAVAERNAERRAYVDMLDTMQKRLSKFETASRQSSETNVAHFKREIAMLESALRDGLAEVRAETNTSLATPETILRDFAEEHDDGVVLIYTEFDYYKIRNGRRIRKKTVTGWGSGFVVSDEGHIVTNKHVIHPWKFDADLAAMQALDEVQVDPDSLRVSCWTPGMVALDDSDEPLQTTGYNNTKLDNLEVFAVAPDNMIQRSLDLGVDGPTYEVHRLDNNDLVVLRVKKPEHLHPLPLATDEQLAKLAKLDRVMAIGYPRGQNGLERCMVSTSPSMGTVRKVEKTIHVTASIIPGNSGGPLIGPDGAVVGIVTRIYSETLGICITIDHARRLIQRAEKESAFNASGDSLARDLSSALAFY